MQKIKGLIAATFTPFKNDGTLNLKIIPAYAEKLKKDGASGVFVCGTTGEGMFMTEEERIERHNQSIKLMKNMKNVLVV